MKVVPSRLGERTSLCYAILFPGRTTGFRAGFRPDSDRENMKNGPSAGRRPAGGLSLRLSRPNPLLDRSETLDSPLGQPPLTVCDGNTGPKGIPKDQSGRFRPPVPGRTGVDVYSGVPQAMSAGGGDFRRPGKYAVRGSRLHHKVICQLRSAVAKPQRGAGQGP
jgi:hypothetical protein